MMSEYFFCPVCRNAALWADANVAGTGSFCSGACARAYETGQHPSEVGPDLQYVAEDCVDRGAWRHQQGESDFQSPLFT